MSSADGQERSQPVCAEERDRGEVEDQRCVTNDGAAARFLEEIVGVGRVDVATGDNDGGAVFDSVDEACTVAVSPSSAWSSERHGYGDEAGTLGHVGLAGTVRASRHVGGGRAFRGQRSPTCVSSSPF